jgi:hypothetical protein
MRELRNLGIGLVLGLLVSIAIGQAAAPKNAPDPRYQIAMLKDTVAGNVEFFILDHQTNKVYYRLLGLHQLRPDGTPVEKIIEAR